MLSDEERSKIAEEMKVDLNSASALEMQQIPRIGEKMAQNIAAYRQQHGPFHAFTDLDAIPGIGPSMMEVFVKHTRLSGVDTAQAAAPAASAASSKIDLNSAAAEQLAAIPGVGPSMADAIVKYRQEHGGFHSVDELDKVPRIGPAKLAKISPYVTVR